MKQNIISSILLSDQAILKKLPSIFVDSILVDQSYNVVVAGQNVLDLLEFEMDYVSGKNLNYLTGTENLVARLQDVLTNGHFDDVQATLFSKTNDKIRVVISGFYLGLISDINGYIVIRIRKLDEHEHIIHQLQKKTEELDNFIYRTAHDLRGPLATIKGLINLLKIGEDIIDFKRIVPMIEAHANKLDERLFQLTYLSASNTEKFTFHANELNSYETTLRKIIEQNAFVDFLEFHYTGPSEKIEQVDDTLFSSILAKILLYLLSLQMHSTNVQILYNISEHDGHLIVSINANGFETHCSLRNAIRRTSSMYTDVINYPQLMNYYAAQKIALQLNTSIRVEFVEDHGQNITISIPYQKKA